MTSAEQKREAEKFLRRVQTEYPHLLVLGYQAIINGTVEGAKRLGIYNDNVTESAFLAGLRHSFDLGILPKPPIQTVEVPAAPTAQQIEDQRLAEEARQNEARDCKYKAQFKDSRHNHAHDPQPTDKVNPQARAQKQAEERCSLISRRTHSDTAQIAKIFVMFSGTSDVDWISTEQARLKMQHRGERVKSINPRY